MARIPHIMGLNIARFCSEHEIGPQYSDYYLGAPSHLLKAIELRQEGGEEVYGILLRTTAIRLSGSRGVEFYTNQDIPAKILEKAIAQTPLPDLLVEPWT